MKYTLRDTRTGAKAVYDTFVEIRREGKTLIFIFNASRTQYYCPYSEYNKLHCHGDACELLIGTDPNRKIYYEIEISAVGNLMVCEMEYQGEDENGSVRLGKNFVTEADCFVEGSSEKTDDGFIATVKIDTTKWNVRGEDVYFNAYRLETDGGTMEKHLFALSPTMCGKFHVPDKYVFLKDYLK